MTKVFSRRASGVLLHPTSLPGSNGTGNLGLEAYRFVDFLHAAGQRLWQVLPLGPTGFGNSPYSGLSAFAGNPLLISPEKLYQEGLLRKDELPELSESLQDSVDFVRSKRESDRFLWSAFRHFRETDRWREDYERFCGHHTAWLDDFALYMALKEAHHERAWTDWADEYARGDKGAIGDFVSRFGEEIEFHKFVQYVFFHQWQALKAYANEKGIQIIGDLPIYVAMDSADTWGRRELFRLDQRGLPLEVGGVPPDYFNAKGQLWGNPIYDWESMAKTGYRWWIERIRHTLSMVDLIRLDHFRGFEAYYAVPYGDETAEKGIWKKGPGAALFRAIDQELGSLPLIVEDLGVITPEVVQLREQFAYPGIKVLQFAFDSNEDNDFIPFRYPNNCVVYTGTHDNDTTRGWFDQASLSDRAHALEYMNSDGQDVVWDFIRLALSSVADAAVFPMQDILSLDSSARFNFPGTTDGNWLWRFQWPMLQERLVVKLARLTKLYGR
ncbi:4-alpha-glucanotransferase [Heliobacterium chlorum]|uniref:4-alpha-glucanotransferase n=1 Tax=Heliobacterium chlorum TaxID=2698 RepID=A0ABR7T0F2_HELCL|nr:4-alpha-glucanotransferase [Heliobacterium chlorum]MBC9784278.1 4-alpha-glucanotransferase [Heliobacterium chlorum]